MKNLTVMGRNKDGFNVAMRLYDAILFDDDGNAIDIESFDLLIKRIAHSSHYNGANLKNNMKLRFEISGCSKAYNLEDIPISGDNNASNNK